MPGADQEIDDQADEVEEEDEDGPQGAVQAARLSVLIDPDQDPDQEGQKKQPEQAGESRERPEPHVSPVEESVAVAVEKSSDDPDGGQDEKTQETNGQKDDEDDADDLGGGSVHIRSPGMKYANPGKKFIPRALLSLRLLHYFAGQNMINSRFHYRPASPRGAVRIM
jgi:hypothetical protein